MTEPLLRMFVEGKPEPAGSKRAIPVFNRGTGKFVHDAKGRPIISVVDDNPKAAAWKKLVALSARLNWKFKPLEEPVELFLVFTVARPLYHFGRRGGLPYLRDDAPAWPMVKPDALKLARAIEDALTGVCYVDDALIVDGHQRKVYGATQGVSILLRRARAVAPAPLIEHSATVGA